MMTLSKKTKREPRFIYWDTLSHGEQQRWIKLSESTGASAQELAYNARPMKRLKLKGWRPTRNIDKPSGYTNEERADSADLALSAYIAAKGQSPDADDMDGMIGDLMSDLCHLAASHGIEPAPILARAANQFEEEA